MGYQKNDGEDREEEEEADKGVGKHDKMFKSIK